MSAKVIGYVLTGWSLGILMMTVMYQIGGCH